MRTNTLALVAAGTLGLTAVAGAAVASPLGTGITSAFTAATADSIDSTEDADHTARLVERIKEALSGLVSDGSITQQQADEVASTLAESDALRGHGHGPGGHHFFVPGLEAAATALGMSEGELHQALRNGTSLGELADSKGVDRQQLVDALVAAATERINEAVSDGKLTREQADQRIADLPDRIADLLDRTLPSRAERPHAPPAPEDAPPAPQDAPTDT